MISFIVKNDIQNIIDHPIVSIYTVGNIFFIESILSIDNAALLASMMMDIKKEDRKKAIKYGIFGAYFFRSVCLIFAYKLIQIWWLKPLGGIYLIYLGGRYFFSKNKKKKENLNNKKNINSFWKTILSIEIMDLSFSIDNIFAAVSLSENCILIFLGIFIGILSTRWITQVFVKIMEKKPLLKDSAFYVIIILGVKLIFYFLDKKKTFLFYERFFTFFPSIIFLSTILISYLFPKKKEG
ncbi:DUF475 domain-containing protein [Blattabacterium cuenoti]|uniref:DUF475 domain-containing protein n=1 Tax=Blattabacterium cuenoti TaxID=1653831 RepID=UPI00163B657F|nr:DUF475 domain-containing protein [Blattabacterium cuenoti]